MDTIDWAGRCSVMSSPLKSTTRKVVAADARVEASMKPISHSPSVRALGMLSEIGDQFQMRTLCGSMIALGLVTSDRRLRNAGARMLVAHEVATLLKDAIKRRVDRTRPRSAESQEDRKVSPGKSTAKEETSFPSGHSAGATAAAFAFAGEYPEHRTPALAAAGAVSAAQVPRCAHYLTDVGAGILIGAAAGAATNLLFDSFPEDQFDDTESSDMVASVEELHWDEVPLGEVEFPKERLTLSAGFGSGLATRQGDPADRVWAICDRGPNIKLSDARDRYGWEAPPEFADRDGAKLMPRADIGPSLALLRVSDDAMELEKIVRLKTRLGEVTGLPIPESGHAECEPVLDLDGKHVTPDPSGMDTEGLAMLSDGTFWASEEYGPSLIKIAADGTVLKRLLPEGVKLADAGYSTEAKLPAIAAKRHLNRGFEAVSVSPSDRLLFVAFQSPLAHPDTEAHKKARHVRLWQLDATGTVEKQYLYPLDQPRSFRRDNARGKVTRADIKVCEVVATREDELLVLERASETSKIYRVSLDAGSVLAPEHLQMDTRPTVEQISSRGAALPELSKELLFTSDDWPEVGADIEGMAILDSRSVLIVSDNDFGCEGKQTRFYRLIFTEEIRPRLNTLSVDCST